MENLWQMEWALISRGVERLAEVSNEERAEATKDGSYKRRPSPFAAVRWRANYDPTNSFGDDPLFIISAMLDSGKGPSNVWSGKPNTRSF